jgi:hypothetical protein
VRGEEFFLPSPVISSHRDSRVPALRTRPLPPAPSGCRLLFRTRFYPMTTAHIILKQVLWGGRASPQQHFGSLNRQVHHASRTRSLRVVLLERRVFRPCLAGALGDSRPIPAVLSAILPRSEAPAQSVCLHRPGHGLPLSGAYRLRGSMWEGSST